MITDADQEQLIKYLEPTINDPLSHVMFCYPWGKGELEGYSGPEEWQKKILEDIRDKIITVEEALRIATSSGHGVGKSALVAWVILWAMSTCVDCRGVITANTATQLTTKTWPELNKWYNLFIAKGWFNITATALYSVLPDHEKTWRFDAITWSEHRTESFAGLHNKGKRIVVIFDEASAIADKIWEVTEGALTDENTQILWVVFGNPTRSSGRFHACFNILRHRWTRYQVDSRRVKITNKKQIDEWIKDYGEDSDFVKIRVRGEFPTSSDLQFIPSDFVEMARGKHLREDQYNFGSVIIGVDGAWSGITAIYLRQGNMAKRLARLHGVKDDYRIAGIIAKYEDEYKADAVFVDLGYGTGIVSGGKQMGRTWQLIAFGGASTDQGYLNKRADMWRQMRQWLKDGGSIPDDPELCAELTSPEHYQVTTGANIGKIFLESKEDMLKRGIASPNDADALALTFAAPVKNKSQRQYQQLKQTMGSFDPLKLPSAKEDAREYNPLAMIS